MEQNKIKVIALDIDGVLTDGRLYIDPTGIESKSFHVKDGMGIRLAQHQGIKIALISERKSEAVNIRSKELDVDFLYENITNKEEALYEIVSSLQVHLDQVFYMGDDLNDIAIMKLVGCSAAPADAIETVKNNADFISSFSGGNGAVREAIEFVLSQQTDSEKLVADFLIEQPNVLQ